jgi:hypothetical protein
LTRGEVERWRGRCHQIRICHSENRWPPSSNRDPGRREPPTRAVKNRERQGNDGRGKVDGEEDD